MGLMHPAYIDEFQEDETAQPDEQWEPRVAKQRVRKRTSLRGIFKLSVPSTKYLPFLAGVGVGIVAVTLVWFPSRTQKLAEPVVATLVTPPLPPPLHEEVVAPPTKLETEVELLKRIVSGLVESVQGLSQRKDANEVAFDAIESFPFPVKVTVDKAHLRKGADRTAPSILEVSKDTTLMAFDGTDKWLKVSTPRGEDAWISRNVVVAKKVG